MKPGTDTLNCGKPHRRRVGTLRFAGVFGVLIVIFFLFGGSVQAQVSCTGGGACNLIPPVVTDGLSLLTLSFRDRYLNPLMETNLQAAFLTNINSSFVGTGNVNRFQIGTGLAVSATKKEDVVIYDSAFLFPKLPNVGASVAPSVSLAINPGRLLGSGDGLFSRFSFWLHGWSARFDNGDIKFLTENHHDITVNGNLRGLGLMVRFNIIEVTSAPLGLISFQGLNVGLGHHLQDQSLHLTYEEAVAPEFQAGPITGRWAGDTALTFDTNVKSTDLDLRLGFGFLAVMKIFLGYGTSRNVGDAKVQFERTGPFVLMTDLTLPASIPRDLAYIMMSQLVYSGAAEGGILSFRLEGYSKMEKTIQYGIFGFEFDLAVAKLMTEIVYGGPEVASANIGVKLTL